MRDPRTDAERFMREAIALSLANVRAGSGGPFGAVVVRDGEIVGRGANRVTAVHDPTAHAEIEAVRDACRRLATHRLDGCEIYSSCEPCPMCLGAIYWARLSRLYFAATRQDASVAGFDDESFYREVQLPLADRSLPAAQLLRALALEAFTAWQSRPDKIPY